MKSLLTLVCCLIALITNAQTEKLNKFHLVDKVTNKPVITSVAIVKAKLSITTEKDGVFIIPGDLKKMTDSIIFSAQNYFDIKMPLKALSTLDTIRLTRLAFKTTNTESKFTRDTLLNNFNGEDVGYFAGLHEDTASFNYLQLAQQFYIDKINTKLNTLQIERLSFNLDDKYGWGIYNNPRLEHYRQIEFTAFKLRIYDINDATGKPGKDLCDSIIVIKLRSSERARINLKDYNINIPHKTFFVAIEWMRDYYNAHYTGIVIPNLKSRFISYKPAIGISPITGKKLNIWALNTNHDWLPYATFSPFGTDLAIKATVGYN
ncbi:MAG TPA: hypothetical protein VNW51_07130 [Mucilaginibacter sp.]|jgi:hypothetical protein|nr:hypothetical protein [Mucilaginibacter sp.]